MNDKAWEAFVELSTQMQQHTGDLIEQQFGSYERRIALLEEENEQLRDKLARLQNTSLIDIANALDEDLARRY